MNAQAATEVELAWEQHDAPERQRQEERLRRLLSRKCSVRKCDVLVGTTSNKKYCTDHAIARHEQNLKHRVLRALGISKNKGIVRRGGGSFSVYILFDAKGRILYVGFTGRGLARIEDHYKSKPWSGDVAKISVHDLESRADALALEKKLIQLLAPLHNIQHNARARPSDTSRRFTTEDEVWLTGLTSRAGDSARDASESVTAHVTRDTERV